MGHATITTPLSRKVCDRWAGTSHDQAVYRTEISTFTHYEDMKGDKNTEIGVVWRLGVTQGHRQHSHSTDPI